MMEWLKAMWNEETHRRLFATLIGFLCTSVAAFVFGKMWGKYKASREWATKHFFGRLLVSLNTILPPRLLIRTIFERSLEDVFINPLAVQKVTDAARQTTAEKPVLPLAKEDRWFILNFVLNAISEEFNAGLVRYDAGLQVKPVIYLICLTCEAVGEDRIRKVRAMMIQKSDLFRLLECDPANRPNSFEQPWHNTRVNTLLACGELYKKESDNFLELTVYV